MPVLGPGLSLCTVIGNLSTLANGGTAYGQVIFQLSNLGTGLVPRVLGTSIFPNITYRAQTDEQGNFSIELWGNDMIDPANTYYLVTFRDSLGNEVGPFQFSIVGTNFNLDLAAVSGATTPPTFTSLGFAQGTALTPSNFALSGWGTGSSISSISGTQQGFIATITAGTSPSMAPTFTLTYPVGFPRVPMIIAIMTGGTGAVSDITVAGGTGSSTYTYNSLPISGKTYIIAGFTLAL